MRNAITLIFLLVFPFSCRQYREDSLKNTQVEFIKQVDRLSTMDSLAYVFEKETLMMDAKLTELSTGLELEMTELNLAGKVIGYISDIQCSTCIDQELEFIKQFYGKDEFVLLGSYSSERDLKLYLLLRDFKLPAYLIKTPLSNLLSRFSNPTYFRIDGGSSPSAVFFASISMPSRSRQYHRIMSSE